MVNKKGFTLIELLIVIAIIAILGAIVFVALDPLRRFRDTRDARRWADLSAIISAVKTDQVDNGGSYLAAITAMTAGQVYIINDGSAVAGCDDNNASCDTAVTADGNCVNLSGLVTEGYLGSLPTSPNGAATWTVGRSGYTLSRAATGIITVRACESENSSEIVVAR